MDVSALLYSSVGPAQSRQLETGILSVSSLATSGLSTIFILTLIVYASSAITSATNAGSQRQQASQLQISILQQRLSAANQQISSLQAQLANSRRPTVAPTPMTTLITTVNPQPLVLARRIPTTPAAYNVHRRTFVDIWKLIRILEDNGVEGDCKQKIVCNLIVLETRHGRRDEAAANHEINMVNELYDRAKRISGSKSGEKSGNLKLTRDTCSMPDIDCMKLVKNIYNQPKLRNK